MPGPKRAAKAEARRKRRAAEAQAREPQKQEVEAQPVEAEEPTPVEAAGERFDETYNRLDENEDLDELTKKELQNLARDRALSTEGTKAEIIKRLTSRD